MGRPRAGRTVRDLLGSVWEQKPNNYELDKNLKKKKGGGPETRGKRERFLGKGSGARHISKGRWERMAWETR